MDADALLKKARYELDAFETMQRYIDERKAVCMGVVKWKEAETKGKFDKAPAWVIDDIKAAEDAETKLYQDDGMEKPAKPVCSHEL